MNKLFAMSIRLKITLLLGLLSTLLLLILYFAVEQIVQNEVINIEYQKAQQIAKIMEPTVSMNHFLQLDSENKELAKKILNDPHVIGLCITFGDETIFSRMPNIPEQELFQVSYPILDVFQGDVIGNILLHYSKDEYRQTMQTLRERFVAVATTIIVLILATFFAVRYLLRPLHELGKTIQGYEVGSTLDFSHIRHEEETAHITNIISGLIDQVNHYDAGMKANQQELLEARERADTANRSKSMFLANMSHEIRTPMNAIIGFIKILDELEENPAKKRYIQTVKNSGESLLGIINDILDFSKIESGKLELEWAEFNPRIEFNNVFKLFCTRCAEKHVAFSVKMGIDIPHCMRSDSLRIKQVLTNFIGNALKFTDPEGMINVHVDFDPDMRLLRFSVRDTGIGISPENQGKIFEAFSQEDSTTTRRFGGTGLGLSISRQLIGMLHGDIGLSSELGKGSEFFFTLPLSPDDDEGMRYARTPDLPDRKMFETMRVGILFDTDKRYCGGHLETYLRSFHVNKTIHYNTLDSVDTTTCDLLFIDDEKITPAVQNLLDKGLKVILFQGQKVTKPPSQLHYRGKFSVLECFFTASSIFDAIISLAMDRQPETAPSARRQHGHYKGRVLVVEDNESNRALMTVLLGRYGMQFDFAVNGADAVEKFRTTAYDLIFMDENMPVMDGIEATRRIRRIEQEEQHSPTPIVALTANALVGDRERFLEIGMDDYLSKPVEQERIENVLARYLTADVRTLPVQAAKHHDSAVPAVSIAERASEKLRLSLPQILKLSAAFIKATRKDLQLLEEAVSSADKEEIIMRSHSISGAARNLYIDTISERARSIETHALHDDTVDYVQLVAELKQHIDHAIDELQHAIDTA